MARARWSTLGIVMRAHAYEAWLALAAGVGGVLELSQGTGSQAAAQLYPRWMLYAIGSALTVGALLTAAGLAALGLAAGDVARVMGYRLEQAGQLATSGVVVVLSLSAFDNGSRGAISGSLDLALALAAATRAREIERALGRTRGRRRRGGP